MENSTMTGREGPAGEGRSERKREAAETRKRGWGEGFGRLKGFRERLK